MYAHFLNHLRSIKLFNQYEIYIISFNLAIVLYIFVI